MTRAPPMATWPAGRSTRTDWRSTRLRGPWDWRPGPAPLQSSPLLGRPTSHPPWQGDPSQLHWQKMLLNSFPHNSVGFLVFSSWCGAEDRCSWRGNPGWPGSKTTDAGGRGRLCFCQPQWPEVVKEDPSCASTTRTAEFCLPHSHRCPLILHPFSASGSVLIQGGAAQW